ncbi:hypothetical protein QBC47DRAFT_388973 [Echria macrotheca]|uniref:Actin-like ATPase domain-containing protein n=1 Tax=Echria macrotheca TaxID=438768 RepID=A0AAJ0B6U4_9PEZI|nr:hypothetical protein QBC47DRAFT_388973 [Echria macrotheca]
MASNNESIWHTIVAIDFGPDQSTVEWIVTDCSWPTHVAENLNLSMKEVHTVTLGQDPPTLAIENTISFVGGRRLLGSLENAGAFGELDKAMASHLRFAGVYTNLRDMLDEPNSLDEEIQSLRDSFTAFSQYDRTSTAGRQEPFPTHILLSNEEIVSQFLRLVAQRFRSDYRKAISPPYPDEGEIPISVVLIQPLGKKWPNTVKRRYVRAALAAFSPEDFPSLEKTYLISELSARGAGLIADYADLNSDGLQRKECALVVDIGEATTLVAVLRVESTKPTMLFSVVGYPSQMNFGRTIIGAAALQDFFPKHVLRVVTSSPMDKSSAFRLVMERVFLSELWNYFDNSLTRPGCDVPEKELQDINLRIPRNPAQLEDLAAADITHIPWADMSEFFGRALTPLQNLMHQKMDTATSQRNETKAIFLTGSLSTNHHIVECVKALSHERGVDFLPSKVPQTSITRGAIRMALASNPRMPPPVEKTTRHYGVCVRPPLRLQSDGNETRTRMLWLIKKGEPIIPGEPTEEKIEINRHFTKKDITTRELSSVTLVACKSDHVADWLSDLSQEDTTMIHLDYTVAEIPENHRQELDVPGKFFMKQKSYTAITTLTVRVTESTGEVEVSCGNKTLGKKTFAMSELA